MSKYRTPITPEPRTQIWLSQPSPMLIVSAIVIIVFVFILFIIAVNSKTEENPLSTPTLIVRITQTKPKTQVTRTLTPTQIKDSTKTPVPKATATPDLWKGCNADYASRLKVGSKAYVSDTPPLSNRLRQGPYVDKKIIGYIDPGETVEILKGPSCSNGWVWWRVRSLKDGEEGWTSEGDEENYWLVPTN